jgi:hypothetical protein
LLEIAQSEGQQDTPFGSSLLVGVPVSCFESAFTVGSSCFKVYVCMTAVNTRLLWAFLKENYDLS